MKEYIKNLTTGLISTHCYDELSKRIPDRADFLQHVKIDLEAGDIGKMRPETLGKIMAALDIGDVMASKEELFGGVHFSGNCEDLLRELVALCLAYVIRDRMDDQQKSLVAPYQRRTGAVSKT